MGKQPDIREPPDHLTDDEARLWQAAQELQLADPLRVRKLAEFFLQSKNHDELSPTVHYYRKDFWLWSDSGVWERHDEESMTLILLEWMGAKTGVSSSPKLAEDLCRNVAALTLTPSSIKLPCWYPPVGPSKDHFWLPMRSYMVAPDLLITGDVESAVSPKSSRWFMRGSVPFDYDPHATCPLWEAWLQDRLVADSQRICLLQEFFGYWLTPDVGNQAALFLLGESATGKSVVTAVAKAMLGEHNVAELPLTSFGQQFALTELDGRLLNICDETGELPKATEHILKWYIGGRPILVDRKFKGHVTLTPTARLVVCVNNFPKFHDTTAGIWRRLHVVPMNQVVDSVSRVTHLERRFYPELPGIFNWALAGLHRLRRQGRFTECVAGEAEKKVEQDSRLAHKAFVTEHIEADANGFVPNTVLVAAYAQWCERNGYDDRATLAVLQHEIERMYQVERGRRDHAGLQCRGLLGVRLKS